MPVDLFIGRGSSHRLDEDETLRRLIPAIETEVLVIDDPEGSLGDGVEDVFGIEALNDPRRYVLQQVLAFLHQNLAAPAQMNELDDRCRRENPGGQAHQVAHGCEAETPHWGHEEEGRDQYGGGGPGNRRPASQAPGDGPGQQDEN